jgi:hypothetical protein
MDTPVHTGFWINWSMYIYKRQIKSLTLAGKESRVLGSTITLPSTQGNFLVAFLALFVHWTGVQLWGIACVLLYRSRYSREGDGLYHQQQAVLRNGVTNTNALMELTKIMAAWRSHTARPVSRSLALILLALFHIAAFAIAGIFSSRVAQTNSEVLVKKGFCGVPERPTKDPSNFTADDWAATEAFYLSSQLREQARLSYVRSCYSDDFVQGYSPCSLLAVDRIDSAVSESANCPFAGELCMGGLVYKLDSGFLNSNREFGINAPASDQVYIRLVSTFAPLDATNFTSDWILPPATINPGEAFKTYSFGPRLEEGQPVSNFTFSYGNYSTFEYPHPYLVTYDFQDD